MEKVNWFGFPSSYVDVDLVNIEIEQKKTDAGWGGCNMVSPLHLHSASPRPSGEGVVQG